MGVWYPAHGKKKVASFLFLIPAITIYVDKNTFIIPASLKFYALCIQTDIYSFIF